MRELQWFRRQRKKEFLSESLDIPVTNLRDLEPIDIQNAIVSFNYHDKTASIYINEIAKWKRVSKKALKQLLYINMSRMKEE